MNLGNGINIARNTTDESYRLIYHVDDVEFARMSIRVEFAQKFDVEFRIKGTCLFYAGWSESKAQRITYL